MAAALAAIFPVFVALAPLLGVFPWINNPRNICINSSLFIIPAPNRCRHLMNSMYGVCLRFTMGLSGNRSRRRKWDLTWSKKADSDVMGWRGVRGRVVGRPKSWDAWPGFSSLRLGGLTAPKLAIPCTAPLLISRSRSSLLPLVAPNGTLATCDGTVGCFAGGCNVSPPPYLDPGVVGGGGGGAGGNARLTLPRPIGVVAATGAVGRDIDFNSFCLAASLARALSSAFFAATSNCAFA
mmetsp:Transcript_41825/g.75328  ORF Transcript_41825/g.75328 Transcript_41825/m.75328 type:complete len:238 (+) Transcript_41825:2137-2850(+)